MARGILTGKRVLDLGRVMAAPYAAQILGDLGAEVIKIERPGAGDDARHYPPVYMPGGTGEKRGDAAHFISVNRNKRSVTVDFSLPAGQDLVRRLALSADVLIENYKTGTLAGYGLGYAELRRLNPRLVYCSITGFGQDGPYAERGGLDPVAQAMSGLMSITGIPDGEPGAGPGKVGMVVEDIVTGKDAATAILAALYERDMQSGEGQYIDIALLDSAVALTTHAAQSYLISGVPPTRHPSMGTEAGVSSVMPCTDGHVFYVGTRDHFFKALCAVLGCDELARDPRYATSALRWQHREHLLSIIHERSLSWQMEALVQALNKVGVPSGPVYNMAQTFSDPQVLGRGMKVPLPHPRQPDLHVVGSPLHFSRTPVQYTLPPPLLGQHTDEVLRELLGLGDDEMAALRRDRVI